MVCAHNNESVQELNGLTEECCIHVMQRYYRPDQYSGGRSVLLMAVIMTLKHFYHLNMVCL